MYAQFSGRELEGAETLFRCARERERKSHTAGADRSTDLSNLYGSMTRTPAMEAVREHCFGLLGVMLRMSARRAMSAWLRCREMDFRVDFQNRLQDWDCKAWNPSGRPPRSASNDHLGGNEDHSTHQFPDLANPKLEAKEIQEQRSGRACLSDKA